MYEAICEAIHRELDVLDEKYEKGTQLSGQDLEHIDRMAHALKSLATYDAMKNSVYTRSRNRYASREGYDPEGYSRRY